MTDRTWAEFLDKVRTLLEPTAAGKGYSTTGIDGQNALYEFVQEMAGPGHALGEIVYKARRYGAKRNPEDLEKIAAWAFLAWRHHQEQQDWADLAVTTPSAWPDAEATAMSTTCPEPQECCVEVPHGDGYGYVRLAGKMGG